MNWENTILLLRKDPLFKEIIHDSYLDEDLQLNSERFSASEEFKTTLALIRSYISDGGTLLDIGAGNGISTIALARNGFRVTALEPDPSSTVGCAAIRLMAEKYELNNVSIVQGFAENLPFANNSFDIVHVRQAMHHAQDLNTFLKEISRVLKPGGFLFTIRDHVVFNEVDKRRFLELHPLHKYYGGENAFRESEYTGAMLQAGLKVQQIIRHFDSVLNYAPLSTENLTQLSDQFATQLSTRAKQKFGILGNLKPVKYIYQRIVQVIYGGALDERRIPGRMYSFVAVKPAID